MTAERVLGVVDFVGKDKNGAPFARLIPVCDVGDAAWRRIDPGEFPHEDRVFWPSAWEAADHALFSFHPERNSGQKDEYRATDLTPATEILDARGLGDMEGVRLSVLSGRLRPLTRALLWCKGDVVVGPVRLRADQEGEFRLDVPNKDRIPVYSSDRLDIRDLQVPRGHRFVLAGDLPSTPDSYVDWDDDRLVVRRAVTWVVERAKRTAATPPLFKKQIDEIAETVIRAAADCENGLERYRLERARALFRAKSSSEVLAAEAAKELTCLPELERALAAVREQVREEAQAELATHLSAERDALRHLQEERTALRAELGNLHTAIAAARTAADTQVRDVEQEVERRVRDVVSRPAAFAAEVAVLRGTMSAPLHSSPTQGVEPVPRPTWHSPARRISDPLELRKSLTAAFKASGVSPLAALRIHGAVVAGLAPVVCGARAAAALLAYGRVVCGERALTIHATPTLLEPTDLLVKSNGAGNLVPHPAGLLATLDAASKEDGIVLVCIEGMNRGATESYLLPLLQSISDATPLRIPPTQGIGERVVSPPPNLRLAGTIVEGATSLPLSRQLWAHAVLIDADSCPRDGARIDPSDVPWTSDLLKPSSAPPEVVDDILEVVPSVREYQETLRLYVSGLAVTEKDELRLRMALIESVVLPLAASLEDEEERTEAITAIEALPGAPERTALTQATRRLRRRIA